MTLFEHTRTGDVPDDLDLVGLETYLSDVWRNRPTRPNDDEADESDNGQPKQQPYIDIRYDAAKRPTLCAGPYVGFVQVGGHTLHLIPKVFKARGRDVAFKHLLWWLEHSRTLDFPITSLNADLDHTADFPEALIRYFARTTYALVGTQPYHRYEEQTETMTVVRGRLNTAQYVTQSLSRGQWHQLVCDHEPFVFNNRLNQIIKHVARRLSHVCRHPATHHLLDKLLFVLDEVDDLPATPTDCDRLPLNRFFDSYTDCVAMCRFFLADAYLSQPDTQHPTFCFLVDMNKLFEQFIAGVLETIPGIGQVRYQNQMDLTTNGAFKIRPDLLLGPLNAPPTLLIDTKYKFPKTDVPDKKGGVGQADVYQMVAYALRYNVPDVVLLYPRAYEQASVRHHTFHVESGLAGNGQPIRIRAIDVPITGDFAHEKEADLLRRVQEELTELLTNKTNL